MDKKKRPYDVTASSLVDLKAELYRKQEEFNQEKLCINAGEPVKPKSKFKKPSVWNKQNEGVSSRAEKDVELISEEENSLDKSKRKLEEKARLYDQMTKGDFPDEETESLFLVDFTQKILDQKRGLQVHRERGQSEVEGEVDTHPEPPTNPDEEWVDYVDAMGRSRRCMKKDLPGFQRMDEELHGRRVEKSGKTLLSEDMRRELQRQQWEREEEEAMKRPVGPVHYENIREQEARELGTGYFAFSQDEALRKKQRDTLDMLRDQTTDQRSRRDKLKDRKKVMLEARLAKVRQRKMKKAKPDGVEDNLGAEEISGDTEEGLIGPPPTAEPPSVATPSLKKVEVEVQERRDTRPGIPHVREWDRGKEFSFGHWTNSRREEREAEFAPPSAYFSEDRTRGFRMDRGGPKLAFRWTGAQGIGGGTAPTRSQHQPQFSSETLSPNPAQSQNLDDLLSFYKHST